MELTTKKFKQCSLVTVKGRVDSGTAVELDEAFKEITKGGVHKIVLDMSDLEFMSSAGMRVLILTQKECNRSKGGELVLASIPQRIQESLQLVGFNPLFTMFDDVLTAVGHF
ncbi:MAG: STAS domain-containing protein [Chloroflexota bacterium]